MWKYFKAVLKISLLVLFNYPRMVYYSRHPDKVPYEKRRKLGFRLYRRVAEIFNIQLKIEGKENIVDGNVVFVSNHQSFYDPIMLSEMGLDDKRIVYIAKKEIKKFPFAGRVSTFLDSIYIDRDEPREAIRVMNDACKKYQEGFSVWVFPEGTRTKKEDHSMNEFKAGTFKLAFKTKATIIPCALCGTWEVLSKKINKKKYEIALKFYKPLTYDDYKNLSTIELSEKIHKMIKEDVDKMLKDYLPA